MKRDSCVGWSLCCVFLNSGGVGGNDADVADVDGSQDRSSCA